MHESGTQDRVLRLLGRQRNGTRDLRAAFLGSIHYLLGALVNELMVIRADFDPDSLLLRNFGNLWLHPVR